MVIPLYGRWEFLRGHVAGFAMDPWFQQGRVRLLYVCDDPRLHLLQRWCAMHLAHEALDISVISLRRNMGFGMACSNAPARLWWNNCCGLVPTPCW